MIAAVLKLQITAGQFYCHSTAATHLARERTAGSLLILELTVVAKWGTLDSFENKLTYRGVRVERNIAGSKIY